MQEDVLNPFLFFFKLIFVIMLLYLDIQILPLFKTHRVLHFNKTDARLANNGIPLDLQKLRCRVNFQAIKFTPQIETLGYKLVRILQEKGPFVALHLRYEMDMLAFSGCTRGCTEKEAEELKQMRYVVLKRQCFWNTHLRTGHTIFADILFLFHASFVEKICFLYNHCKKALHGLK